PAEENRDRPGAPAVAAHRVGSRLPLRSGHVSRPPGSRGRTGTENGEWRASSYEGGLSIAPGRMRRLIVRVLPLLAALVLPACTGCSVVVSARAVALLDTSRLRLVRDPAPGAASRPPEERETDILVAGGSLGGVAAALGACDCGRRVVLAEESDQLGG